VPVTLEPAPAFVAGMIVFLTLVMLGAARSGRKNRSLINWNFLDGVFVGLCSLCEALPGGGRPEGAFTGAFLRNYDLQSTIRFSFLALVPFHLFKLKESFSAIQYVAFPTGMSERISLGVGFVIALFATALAMGALLVRNREVGFKRFGIYRIVLALILAAWALRPQVL
jgi:undecaprenyl-diphosphatase